jgi:hypothetical protein
MLFKDDALIAFHFIQFYGNSWKGQMQIVIWNRRAPGAQLRAVSEPRRQLHTWGVMDSGDSTSQTGSSSKSPSGKEGFLKSHVERLMNLWVFCSEMC